MAYSGLTFSPVREAALSDLCCATWIETRAKVYLQLWEEKDEPAAASQMLLGLTAEMLRHSGVRRTEIMQATHSTRLLFLLILPFLSLFHHSSVVKIQEVVVLLQQSQRTQA